MQARLNQQMNENKKLKRRTFRIGAKIYLFTYFVFNSQCQIWNLVRVPIYLTLTVINQF